MRTKKIFLVILISLFILLGFPLLAQDEETKNKEVQEVQEVQVKEPNQESDSKNFEFDLGVIMGMDLIDQLTEENEIEIYQSAGIKPTLRIGSFGLSFDLTIRYRFLFDEDSFMEVKKDDWIPDTESGETFLDLYLPKIDYLRIGGKGEGFYLRVGQINETTIGTGFLMNNYSNVMYNNNEIVGLNFDLDGKSFNFPYFGIESVVGNIARLDVFGARLYLRPFGGTDVAVIKDIEIGVTAAGDRTPDIKAEYYETELNSGEDAEMILMYNGDLIIPLVNKDLFSLALSGNFCYQNGHLGGDAGIGGTLFSIVPYLFQFSMYGDNFVPSYFDYTYDLNRGRKYDAYTISDADSPLVDKGSQWTAGTGFVLFEERLILDFTADGPIATPPTDDDIDITSLNYLDYYHLHAGFKLAGDLIPNLTVVGRYDKMYINSLKAFLENKYSVFDVLISYSTGNASINFDYKWVYSGDDDASKTTRYDFDIRTSIYCTFNLF